MKTLALILSFYVLSLTAAPAVALLREKFKCSESCSKKEIPNDSNGCEKQSCSAFACCYKIVGITFSYKENQFFAPYKIVKNSFGYTNPVLKLHSFDIWHPPRIG